jgi:integrase
MGERRVNGPAPAQEVQAPMQSQRNPSISGHVYEKVGKRGSTWYYRARLPHEVRKALGPTWKGSGRPPAGHFTRKTAQAALDAILVDARRGSFPAGVRSGATVADAAAEWLRHREQERALKPSTMDGYRTTVCAHILPAFGELPIEQVTTAMVEEWRSRLLDGRHPRTVNKIVTELHGIFERARKVWPGLPPNPVADLEALRYRRSAELAHYEPDEVRALVRAAESEQDAAIFTTAAFSGLRLGELRALRVREVDFQRESIRVVRSFTHGALTEPKAGKGRTVPMAPEVAVALARLLQRDRFIGPDDLVFPGIAGSHFDESALRRRYKASAKRAKLPPLRFHDLRHTFGTVAAEAARSDRELQEWGGWEDLQTAQRYMHYRKRSDGAKRIAAAFAIEEPQTVEAVGEEPARTE